MRVPGHAEAPDRTVARAGAMVRTAVRPSGVVVLVSGRLERRRVRDDAEDGEDGHEHDEQGREEAEGIHPGHLGRRHGRSPSGSCVSQRTVR